MIFRVDDLSVRTFTGKLEEIIRVIRRHEPDSDLLFAVSPMVHWFTAKGIECERAFPRELSAMSDHRNFFKVNSCGIPKIPSFSAPFTLASHGLVHVDHRLLGREAQELSIVTSCSLVGSKVFVPPFNKWNRDTESVCLEHGLELVKFEDGWKHVNYNVFDHKHEKYYLHTHDTSPERLAEWFRA